MASRDIDIRRSVKHQHIVEKWSVLAWTYRHCCRRKMGLAAFLQTTGTVKLASGGTKQLSWSRGELCVHWIIQGWKWLKMVWCPLRYKLSNRSENLWSLCSVSILSGMIFNKSTEYINVNTYTVEWCLLARANAFWPTYVAGWSWQGVLGKSLILFLIRWWGDLLSPRGVGDSSKVRDWSVGSIQYPWYAGVHPRTKRALLAG